MAGGAQMEKRIGKLIIAIGSAVSIGLTIKFPNFWVVFLVPGAVLVALQCAALSRWRGRRRLFVFTDYFHYSVVAIVVTLGARYYVGYQTFANYNNKLESEGWKARIAQIDRDLPALEEEAKSIASFQPDPEFLAQCMAKQIDLRPTPASKSEPYLRLDPCLGYLAAAQRGPTLSRQLVDLKNERQLLSAKVQDYDNRNGGPGNGPGSPPPQPVFDYILAPTLLLSGVAVKLAKTTSALRDSPA
jgi:hypothetical protein